MDEAADEPGTGDSHNLWPRSAHPHRLALLVTLRNLRRPHQRLGEFAPGFPTAFESLSLKPFVAKPRGPGSVSCRFGTRDDSLAGISPAPAFPGAMTGVGAAGMSPGSDLNSPSVRTSMSTGAPGSAARRESCVKVISVGEGCRRPPRMRTRTRYFSQSLTGQSRLAPLGLIQ
jgi:hypothetical protein